MSHSSSGHQALFNLNLTLILILIPNRNHFDPNCNPNPNALYSVVAVRLCYCAGLMSLRLPRACQGAAKGGLVYLCATIVFGQAKPHSKPYGLAFDPLRFGLAVDYVLTHYSGYHLTVMA